MDWSLSAPTWITAIATALLAGFGIATAWAAIVTLRDSRADSLARTRPYIFAHLVPGVSGLACWDLIIKNAGESTASNLHVGFDSLPDTDDDVTGPLRQLSQTSLTLPPGMSYRVLWSIEPSEGETWSDGTRGRVGMGNTANVTTSYDFTRIKGRKRKQEVLKFNDDYQVRTAGIGLTPVPEEGPDLKREAKLSDIHKQLGLIARSIRMSNY